MVLHLSEETLRRLVEDVLGQEVENGEHAEVLKLVEIVQVGFEQASALMDLSKVEPIAVYRPEEGDDRVERKTAL